MSVRKRPEEDAVRSSEGHQPRRLVGALLASETTKRTATLAARPTRPGFIPSGEMLAAASGIATATPARTPAPTPARGRTGPEKGRRDAGETLRRAVVVQQEQFYNGPPRRQPDAQCQQGHDDNEYARHGRACPVARSDAERVAATFFVITLAAASSSADAGTSAASAPAAQTIPSAHEG